MELERKRISTCGDRGRAETQMTVEEDFIVPDILGDMEEIIAHKQDVVIENVKVAAEKVLVRGKLTFAILYSSPEESKNIHSMEGAISFEESIHMEGAKEGENCDVRWTIEDINIHPIHSRKICVKAILQFAVSQNEHMEREAVGEVRLEPGVQTKKKKMDYAEPVVLKHEIFRVKDEIEIDRNKPNIREILWNHINIRSSEARVLEGKISVQGELLVFVLYRPEDDDAPLQWMESTLPFSGVIDLLGADPALIPNISIVPLTAELTVKPDYDGEQRIVGVDAVLEIPMKMFQEKQVELLEDAYSLRKQLQPRTERMRFERILMKNASRCKVADKLKIDEAKGRILQICHGEGSVSIDDVNIVEQGIEIEGVLKVMILYAASEDRHPLAMVEGVIPFHHKIDIPGITRDSYFELNQCVEQMNAIMVSGEEIQVKAVILLDAFVVNEESADVIMDLKEEPLDTASLERIPGMIGYQVKDDDDLWSIAKRYRTTVAGICEMNELKSEQVRTGDRLLLIKEVRGL